MIFVPPSFFQGRRLHPCFNGVDAPVMALLICYMYIVALVFEMYVLYCESTYTYYVESTYMMFQDTGPQHS